MLPTVVDLLKTLDLPISKDWIYAGRPCSPRVLFTFENCPKEIYNYDLINENNSDKLIEKLQHSLEDQIYNSLRKSYVITNISNNSLFAIPPNQEFAYIHRLTTKHIDNNKFLLTNISKDKFNLKETSIDIIDLDADLFRKFLFSHTQIAINEGFNDNIGRQNVQPVFELPRASQWYKIFDALVDLILKDPPKTTKIQSHFTQIKTHLDIDAQFSENRCKKILPSALNLYEENLPNFYTKAQHNQRVCLYLFYKFLNSNLSFIFLTA
jgi:protein SMG8